MSTVMQPAILAFTAEHRYLSNFYPSVIRAEGISYPTVEHAFQAAKTTDTGLRRKIAEQPWRHCRSCGPA